MNAIKWACLLIPAVLPYTMGTGCVPEQPDTFCTSSDDCPKGHVCNAFSRHCSVDITQKPAGQDLWGEFYCVERLEKDTENRGYLAMGMKSSLFPIVQAKERPTTSYGLITGPCGMTYVDSHNVWQLFGNYNAIGDKLGTISIAVDKDRFYAGGMQTAPRSQLDYIFVFQGAAPDHEVLLKVGIGEVKIIEIDQNQKPRGVRGEFRGQQ